MRNRVLTSLMTFVLLVSMPSCMHRGDSFERATYMPQMRSLSLSGPNQASVILEKTRELRLTTNAGQTWQVIPAAAGADTFESATLIDGQRGWAVNHQGHVFVTHSSGATWSKISELKDFTCANQIEFLNEKDGWIRECLSIWRTRDGGITWRKTLSTVTPGVLGQPTGVFPVNADSLVSSGSGGQVYLTKDGGETWRIETPLAGDNIDFNDVWFADQNHGWLAGYQVLVAGESLRALLLETTDGGESWKELAVDADIRPSSVCFVGDQGWLAGSRRIVDGESVKLVGVLLSTKDGGRHWNPVQFGPEEPFFTDVRFTDERHGWIAGRDSLYRTEDGGKTWSSVLRLPPIE
jgi:photosystem II stability/assembly factor-like uncharacterized protein